MKKYRIVKNPENYFAVQVKYLWWPGWVFIKKYDMGGNSYLEKLPTYERAKKLVEELEFRDRQRVADRSWSPYEPPSKGEQGR